jgi:hypothetical protein
MRQVHPAGERLFVDYAGQTVELVDGRTGEIGTAQIFVAVLVASSYTYAEATRTQTLPDWIGAHVRALAFFGGVPRQIVGRRHLDLSVGNGPVLDAVIAHLRARQVHRFEEIPPVDHRTRY